MPPPPTTRPPLATSLITPLTTSPDLPVWKSDRRYFNGNIVTYNGRQYIVRDQGYKEGTPPGLTPNSNSNIWTDLGALPTMPPPPTTRPPLATSPDLPVWSSDKRYFNGNIVTYNGRKYIVRDQGYAEGTPQGVTPPSDGNLWTDQIPTWNPEKAYFVGDGVTHNEIRYIVKDQGRYTGLVGFAPGSYPNNWGRLSMRTR
jgi:chitodextrinase